MSTNEPRGRLSPAVYRRRRLLLLAGLVAIIIVIVLLIWQPGARSGDGDTPSGGSSTPATTPSQTPSAEADAEVSADGEITACTSKNLLVEALSDKTTYAAGELPQLSLQITNTGKTPCTVNAGTSQQVFTITSGSEVYWTSTDCQTESADAEVQLEAGQTVASSAPISWDRTRSSTSTCDGERPAVPAGGASYHLSTSVAGIESEATRQFLLS